MKDRLGPLKGDKKDKASHSDDRSSRDRDAGFVRDHWKGKKKSLGKAERNGKSRDGRGSKR